MADDLQPINDSWLSGQPFYCAVCGVGIGEFMACEDVDCRLETVEAAQSRLRMTHRTRQAEAGQA